MQQFSRCLGGRRTVTAEEVISGRRETRPLDRSSSFTDPDPTRLKPTTVTDVENPADQMDEDTSLRTHFSQNIATSHPLDPDARENVSETARVARNVLHIRGEDELKN